MKTHCRERGAGRQTGFTLIEVLVAVILVGIAIASLLAANGAYTQVNGAGIDLSTAEFLIEQVRERSTALPYDDLDDFDDAAICPPVDAEGTPLAEFASFTQQIAVENVSAASLDTVVADGASDFVRFTVTILQNGSSISSASWIRARY